jgi:hypothetical protein
MAMRRQVRTLLVAVSLAVLVSGGEILAQSISIFGNAVPSDPTGGRKTVTLGVKFWSSQAGTVSAIRFYRAAPAQVVMSPACIRLAARFWARLD